jgi:hypothetical protein
MSYILDRKKIKLKSGRHKAQKLKLIKSHFLTNIHYYYLVLNNLVTRHLSGMQAIKK